MSQEVAVVAVAGMITFLVFVGMLGRVEMAKARAKASAPDDVVARLEGIAAESAAEVARLKERVAVLERLATDEDRRVASEINRLGSADSLRG